MTQIYIIKATVFWNIQFLQPQNDSNLRIPWKVIFCYGRQNVLIKQAVLSNSCPDSLIVVALSIDAQSASFDTRTEFGSMLMESYCSMLMLRLLRAWYCNYAVLWQDRTDRADSCYAPHVVGMRPIGGIVVRFALKHLQLLSHLTKFWELHEPLAVLFLQSAGKRSDGSSAK